MAQIYRKVAVVWNSIKISIRYMIFCSINMIRIMFSHLIIS